MNKFLIAFTVFSLYLILSMRIFYSQSETTVQDILQAVDSKITELEENKKCEIVNITVDLLVNQGTKSITRMLDPNYEYSILVIGDRRISKLKLSLYKQGKGSKDYVNESSSLSPVLKFTPDEFDIYEIMVGAQEFKDANSTGHFAILIYHGDALKR